MKKFLLGFLVGCLLMMSTPVLADSIMQSIDVVLNNVEVQINGENLDTNTILYNGSTYLPMRKIAEAVNKNIEWNQDTMTANIVEKKDGDSLDEIVVYQENGYNYLKKNGELYYENNYIFDLIKEYKNYSWYGYGDGENIKISLIKTLEDETEEVLIEYVPYFLYKNRVYISDAYLGNSILPLIK